MIERRKTRTVMVGALAIGSPHPVRVQSMTKTDTVDVDATVCQINALEKAGCEIVRVAVRHMEAARAIRKIKAITNIPVVADIHFDSKLAMESLKNGADKIRINPGNMPVEGMREVAKAAAKKKIPVRIGVNSGSLPEDKQCLERESDVMAALALRSMDILREEGLLDIIVSLKASDVRTTVEAYRGIAEKFDCPLHLGVTAAGLPADGIVRSSVGMGSLLLDGIGDTIRVSLTGDPVCEVDTAKRILSSVGLRNFGPEIISCPTCGRCRVDLVTLAGEFEEKLRGNEKLTFPDAGRPLVIALMGCEINGPGEAKNADIGIAFGSGTGAIFENGKILNTVSADNAIDELLRVIEARRSSLW
ncbi:MAG: flavodoxin-dependent (E)-4-hydroxy-3-methylbut-2-enyl-diphosphate synthase [Candidatus Omnitrophica bacterium]|nr:flavodoxin-dependent (E)-4-hydroxy-3-methylbut-2-enyl-diphosphate synthase [Candidatus Omnitrophota bacterium]MBU1127679.1 flavodoxin-dependent (E)-4-hydroxy-3-methylbut-2-enyl-diphosphate synthase [Candidatus Omnitrophota bacterium]MBU1784700.1 flavodoxin-dependent (E)-4-hydroxy-3-methylbut-2-enyl-diphosphate synthase [Candidatus Omnitrophota bacterium]MBU1851468.1 flavodoxin-dependent (E)-4-hydroxy-3-methylbut-2-enyl-diphosphate synthase [Candidatus Omnitrophota bacterium]